MTDTVTEAQSLAARLRAWADRIENQPALAAILYVDSTDADLHMSHLTDDTPWRDWLRQITADLGLTWDHHSDQTGCRVMTSRDDSLGLIYAYVPRWDRRPFGGDPENGGGVEADLTEFVGASV